MPDYSTGVVDPFTGPSTVLYPWTFSYEFYVWYVFTRGSRNYNLGDVPTLFAAYKAWLVAGINTPQPQVSLQPRLTRVAGKSVHHMSIRDKLRAMRAA